MSDEELKMKKLINTSYYNSLTKAEKQFYWFFIFVLNFLVIFWRDVYNKDVYKLASLSSLSKFFFFNVLKLSFFILI